VKTFRSRESKQGHSEKTLNQEYCNCRSPFWQCNEI